MNEKAVLILKAVTADNHFIHHHFWYDQGYLSYSVCLVNRIKLALAWAHSEIVYLECLIQ